MNDTAPPRELYCLLIPLAESKILLPRDLVVEVMGGVGLIKPRVETPPWHLGWRSWQDRLLPVVSLEAYHGASVPMMTARSRFVCILAIGEGGWDHYVFLTKGYPYLVRVTPSVLRPDPEPQPGVLSQVRFGNDRPYIPDLVRLEHDLAALPAP